MTKTLFLVIDADDHTDTVYYLRRDKQAALNLARQLADRSQECYGNMAMYSTPCNGRDGWWFCESGEERWRVTVREVSLQ